MHKEAAQCIRCRVGQVSLSERGFAAPDVEAIPHFGAMEKQGGRRRQGSLEFRVGEKGGVSVYGLGRFPVTLYYEQWIRLLDSSDQLRAFLEENKGKLKLKQI